MPAVISKHPLAGDKTQVDLRINDMLRTRQGNLVTAGVVREVGKGRGGSFIYQFRGGAQRPHWVTGHAERNERPSILRDEILPEECQVPIDIDERELENEIDVGSHDDWFNATVDGFTDWDDQHIAAVFENATAANGYDPICIDGRALIRTVAQSDHTFLPLAGSRSASLSNVTGSGATTQYTNTVSAATAGGDLTSVAGFQTVLYDLLRQRRAITDDRGNYMPDPTGIALLVPSVQANSGTWTQIADLAIDPNKVASDASDRHTKSQVNNIPIKVIANPHLTNIHAAMSGGPDAPVIMAVDKPWKLYEFPMDKTHNFHRHFQSFRKYKGGAWWNAWRIVA